MPVATFDTLKFANTLKAAGVPPQHAEAEAVALAEVIQLNFKELVTKDDLKVSEKDVRQEIKDVEQRLGARIDLMAAENKAFQAAVRGEMVLVRWMLGFVITVLTGVAIRLFFYRGTL